MRILVLVTDAFGGHGGISKFNRDLLSALCSYPECTEVVALPRLMPKMPEALPPKLSYVTEGLGGKGRYLKALWHTARKKPEFDLILCGHINLLPLAFACRIGSRTPLGLIIHGIDAWKPTGRFITDYLAKRVDAVIAVSRYTLDRFRKWSGVDAEKGHILPNTVDLTRFTPGPKDPMLVDRYNLLGKRVLMTLGRLAGADRYKGFDEIMELMPKLVEEDENLVYLIAGDGKDRSRLEEKVRQLHIENHVIFTGYVSESEKVNLYRLADAYVMPSKGEGFGIVFLEAMACGIPVLGSIADGSREALREGELGELVDPEIPDDVLTGIRKALRKTKGVPEGVKFFTEGAFNTRLSDILANLKKSNAEIDLKNSS